MASGEKVKFVLSGKLIQQLFDYPLCLAKALSTKLNLRAVHCLCELWICRLYRLSSSPGRAERLLTPHSHPSIPLPPSLHPPVSCLLSAALRPCHLRDTPDHQGPGGRLRLVSDGPRPGNNGERYWTGWGSGADGGLVVGIFLCCGSGRRVKVWLHVARPWIYRDAVALCGQVTSYRAPPWKTKTMKPLRKKKWHFTVTWRKLKMTLHLSVTQALNMNICSCRYFVSAPVGRRFSYHPT